MTSILSKCDGKDMLPSGGSIMVPVTLLGMAFIALDLAVPEMPEVPGESPICVMERGLFATALGVNRVRNRQGSGHGRPWLPTLTDTEAKVAIESVGVVTSYLLAKLGDERKVVSFPNEQPENPRQYWETDFTSISLKPGLVK